MSGLGIEHNRELDSKVFGPLIEARLREAGLGEVGAEGDASGLVGVSEAVQFGDVAVGDRALNGEKKLDTDLLDRMGEQW